MATCHLHYLGEGTEPSQVKSFESDQRDPFQIFKEGIKLFDPDIEVNVTDVRFSLPEAFWTGRAWTIVDDAGVGDPELYVLIVD